MGPNVAFSVPPTPHPERRSLGRGCQGGRRSGLSEGLPDTFLPSVPGGRQGQPLRGPAGFLGSHSGLWGCRDHPDHGGDAECLWAGGQSQGNEASGAQSGCWERVHTAGGCFLKWL